MKNSLLLLLCLVSISSRAQLHADLYAGIANYQGDLQTKRFDINQSKPNIGVGLSYDLSPHFIIRGAANYLKVAGADAKPGAIKDQVVRNLSFQSTIWEAQLGLEYNILDIEERGFTPYLMAGIAAYHFNPYAFNPAGNKVFLRSLATEGQGLSQYPGKQLYKNNQLAIPFGGGIKLALTDRLQVGLEIDMRKLFTDYLDDVSGTYADSAILAGARGAQAAAFAYRGTELAGAAGYPVEGAIRGNPKHKDWYFTTGLKISYSLGNIGKLGGSAKKSKTGCPVNVY